MTAAVPNQVDPKILIAQHVLGWLESREIVALAHYWLEQWNTWESLFDITWDINPHIAEVGPAFEKLIQEMQIEMPTRQEALVILMKDTLEKMANGENILREANFLYWELYREVEDQLPNGELLGSNMGFERIIGLLYSIEDLSDYLRGTELEKEEGELLEELQQAARERLEQPLTIPSRIQAVSERASNDHAKAFEKLAE